MKKILIVILIVVLTGLAYIGYIIGIPSLIKGFFVEEGKACGGFVQHPYFCKSGYECIYKPEVIDAPGVCVKIK